VVTKDATDQIIPQPSARPIRPAGTPLNGATITNHQSTGTNAYALNYTLSGQNYTVAYSWNAAQLYTMSWGAPTGTTVSTYNGQVCQFATPTNEVILNDSYVKIYPNPTQKGFSLDLRPPLNVNEVKSISVYDVKGSMIFNTNQYTSFIELPSLRAGIYMVQIQFPNAQWTKQLIVQ
jgi:hypothetical protein